MSIIPKMPENWDAYNDRPANAKPSGKTAQGQEQHTKGPWRARDDGLVFFPDRAGGFSLQNCPEPEANARRIVACVNACEGISNDDLEQYESVGSLLAERDALAAQNIELVEALKGLLAAWDAEAANGSLYPADVHKAHALLARLKP